MKGLAVVSKGMEEICATEIQEKLNVASQKKDRTLIFPIKNITDLAVYTYTTQSSDYVTFFLGHGHITKTFTQDITNAVLQNDLKHFLNQKTYDIRCARSGQHPFSSQDIVQEIRKGIKEAFSEKYNTTCDYTNPKCIIQIFVIDNNWYAGIDFAGFPLHKRQYKVTTHASSLRGPIGYALVRLSGFKKNETLIDPFLTDGVTIIEAAHFITQFPINYYNKEKFMFNDFDIFKSNEKETFFRKYDNQPTKQNNIYGYSHLFKHIDATKKNIHIAGLKNSIKLARKEISWLDISFDEKSVHRIITKLPSQKTSSKKYTQEFFHQARYILTQNGKIALITFDEQETIQCAQEHNFIKNSSHTIFSGKQPLTILVFRRS